MIDANSRSADAKSKKTDRLKQIITKLSVTKPQTGALGRIQSQNGEIISDPKQMSRHLISFFKAWFGEGRKNRWNVNPDGTSAHPLNNRDARGLKLVEALLVGNYYEIAKEGEELPEVVKQLYDRGLLSYKTNKDGNCLSEKEVGSIRASFSPEEWLAARTSKVKKCTHPGADKITKPALFYCSEEIFQELGTIVFLAEELGYIIKQHKVVQMWLIPKDAGFEKIDRLRPLWFESDILKMKEFVIESRVDKLLRKKGMLEPEQSGFEKNRDCGAAIFPVAQLIEDSRVRNRQLWVAFLDQMKAFDTLESFQGKLMASMVLGLPFKYANQLVKFDESVIASIITAYGTTEEILGFAEGTFTPECGGLQGGPRSPGMWKRFYDLLIRAQKLIKTGKLAYIQGEDGEIILTAKVFADDTALFSGDHENMAARAFVQQLLIDYSGSSCRAHKCILTAILYDASGNLKRPAARNNLPFRDINTGISEMCSMLSPNDRFRYLGWFSCMSFSTDQSFNQLFEQ